MNNLLKILAVFLIFMSFSCEKKQDWNCVCEDRLAQTFTTIIIEDVKEKEEARKLCNFNDIPGGGFLGVQYTECELEE